MPKLAMVFRHSLPRQEALSRIQSLLGDIKREQSDKISDLKEKWKENVCEFSFKAMGFNVSGTLEVTTGEVKLNGNLPFAALIFKGTIESAIRERAERLLSL